MFRRLTFVALLLVSTCSLAWAQDDQIADGIAAVVGDQIILRSDILGLAQNLAQQQGLPLEAAKERALQNLIDQQVLATHATRDTTIKITQDQVNQALDQRVEQMIAQVGSRSQLEQMYGRSVEEIKQDIRGDFRNQMLAQRMQQRKVSKIDVTPSEVRAFFDSIPQDSLPTLPDLVQVSHIVKYPDVPESARQQTIDRLSSIRDSIVAGESSFEEMARLYSQDPGSAPSGGRISGITLDVLVPEFSAVASRLEPGTISDVFRSPFGYHIVRVNERRGDQVDLNHILLRVDETETDPTEAIAELEGIRDTLMTTEIPFGHMAKKHSDEESSAARAGQVVDPRTGNRMLRLDALGPSWQETIGAIEEGEISAPAEVQLLDGQNAYHIVLLEEYKPSHRLSFEEDYARLRQLALQDKQSRIMREWLDELRDEVYVDVRADELISSARN